MNPEERTQALNSLPNELRKLFKEIERQIIVMEDMEDSGQINQQQRRNFFALIIDCIPYAQINYPKQENNDATPREQSPIEEQPTDYLIDPF